MSRYLLNIFFQNLFPFYLAQACVGHDGNCHGANGSQGDCCGGMHCQKNDPSWAVGKCYYNPGK